VGDVAWGLSIDIDEIKNLLETNRLVTLVGSGGVGKTSASLEVGMHLGPRFKEGVWFIELAPLTDPHLIPEIILSLFKTLSAILRQKQALLILDNCEHLIAAIASLADTIIRGCPNISKGCNSADRRFHSTASRGPLLVRSAGQHAPPSQADAPKLDVSGFGTD